MLSSKEPKMADKFKVRLIHLKGESCSQHAQALTRKLQAWNPLAFIWTPEGRRLVTGASSGEFTLWNGMTYNFETILQAHDSAVRSMVWSHNDQWMITADHAGFIKYWQTNMNNVKMYQGHKDPVRGLSFCPTDTKFVSCSDDGTVRVWDFLKCHEEKILRGHGADVKTVDWHPQKSIIASGSKDAQQPIKLWDAKTGISLATIHAHKNTVMTVQWNQNGNWLLTASRDHLCKIFDIRNLKEEMQTFKGHKKEATVACWHPINEGLFASGGSDGALMFWMVGADKEVGSMEQAHDHMIWTMAWHPMGHILATGSNDHSTRFWTRNRPGDSMRDRYNLNLNSLTTTDIELEDLDGQGAPSLPGMGLEHGLPEHLTTKEPEPEEKSTAAAIPGLDWEADAHLLPAKHDRNYYTKKIPFSRPVPRKFEAIWKENKQPGFMMTEEESRKKRDLESGHRKDIDGEEFGDGKGGPVPLMSLQIPDLPAKSSDSASDKKQTAVISKEDGPGMNSSVMMQRNQSNRPPGIINPDNIPARNMGPGIMGQGNIGPRPMMVPENMLVNMGPGNKGPMNVNPANMGPRNMGSGSMGNVGPGNMNRDNMGPGNMNQGNMGPGNMNRDMGPGNMNRDMGPGKINQANMGPGNMNQGNMGPGNMNPANMGPGNMNQANIGPGNMNQANMGPGNMNQGNVGPGNMNQANMGPGNMNRDMGPGNMNRDMGPGNMNRDMGPGNMNRDVGPGNMNRDMGPGNMNQGNLGPGNMNRDMGPGNMTQGNMGPGNMNRDMGPGNMNRDMGRGNMNQGNTGPGNMNREMGPGNMVPGNQMQGNMGPANMNQGNMGPGNQMKGNMGPVNQGNMGPVNQGNMGTGNMNQGNMGPGNQVNMGGGSMNQGNMGPGNQGNMGGGNQTKGNLVTGNMNPGNMGTGNQGNMGTGNQMKGNMGTGNTNQGNMDTGNQGNMGMMGGGNMHRGDMGAGNQDNMQLGNAGRGNQGNRFRNNEGDIGFSADNDSRRVADDSRRGADDSRRGADDSRRGADDSRRGPDDSSRGPDDSRRGPDDSRRGPSQQDGQRNSLAESDQQFNSDREDRFGSDRDNFRGNRGRGGWSDNRQQDRGNFNQDNSDGRKNVQGEFNDRRNDSNQDGGSQGRGGRGARGGRGFSRNNEFDSPPSQRGGFASDRGSRNSSLRDSGQDSADSGQIANKRNWDDGPGEDTENKNRGFQNSPRSRGGFRGNSDRRGGMRGAGKFGLTNQDGGGGNSENRSQRDMPSSGRGGLASRGRGSRGSFRGDHRGGRGRN